MSGPQVRSFAAAKVTQKGTRGALAAVVMAGLAVLALPRLGLDQVPGLMLGALTVGLLGTVAGIVAGWRAKPSLRPVRVDASARGLRVPGSTLLRSADVLHATVAPALGGVLVTLLTRWRRRALWLATPEDAETLLGAMAIDPGSRLPAFACHGSLAVIVASAIALGIAAILARAAGLLQHWLMFCIPPMVGVISLLVRRTLTVGEDGVRIADWRGQRFVPYAALAKVEASESAVVLRVRGEETIVLRPHTFAGIAGAREIPAVVAEVVGRSRAAWEARAAARTDAPLTTIPGAPDGGVTRYRVPAVPRERLVDLVEDTAAAIDLRVAAAQALADDEDDPTRARLARVMGTSASPELRRALKAPPEKG